MRISDWSSDVCSSDLQQLLADGHATGNHTFHHLNGWNTPDEEYLRDIQQCRDLVRSNLFRPPYGRIRKSQIVKLRQSDNSMRLVKIGRASCRERVCQYV